jgi:hypothetical protein
MLCRRWGQTPPTIRALNYHDVMQMMALLEYVQTEQDGK